MSRPTIGTRTVLMLTCRCLVCRWAHMARSPGR